MTEPNRIARALTLSLPWPPSVNTADCIDGPGERTRLGYVRIWRYGRRVLAHRAAYEDARGQIPSGLELDHLCRNRWCRNPAHLEPVKHAENSRRSAKCKLNFERADRIRALFATGGYTKSQLGRMFGVTKQSIALVVKGAQWVR